MVFAEGYGQLEYEQKHVYAGSERIEQFTDKGNWERTLYVHEDVMGNTRYYTKANGQSFAELTYDAWGMPESPNKLLNNDHGNYVFATFTGHIYDTTLDIYFAEARFYDANNRTWLVMDPVKDGLNWYQYCYSNPTTYWDPLGLWGTSTGSKQEQLSGSSTGISIEISIEIPGFIKRLPGNLFSFIAGLGSSITKAVTFGILPDAPINDFETAYYSAQVTGSVAIIALGIYLGLGGFGSSAAIDAFGRIIVISQAQVALIGSAIAVDGGLVFRNGFENLIQESSSKSGTESGIKTGDTTPNGKEFTTHASEQANKRGYSPEDVDNIINNWTQKFYQPGGRTAYLRKQSYGYDVVVIDKNGKTIVSVVGGNVKNGVNNTLPDLSAVKRMLMNTGGYSTIPLD